MTRESWWNDAVVYKTNYVMAEFATYKECEVEEYMTWNISLELS